LHPIFFGSFDWHSCVHSYWLLATLYRLYPDLPERSAIRTLFSDSFAKEKIAGERAYLRRPSAGGFERPYGWAWLLMLQAELFRHETPEAKRWAAVLRPLAAISSRASKPICPSHLPQSRRRPWQHRVCACAGQEYAATAHDKNLAD